MRMTAKARKAEILAAAMGLARERGFNRVLLTDVAKAAGCTHGLVLHYFHAVGQLHRAIMSEALHTGDAAILAQGLAVGNPKALKAPDALKLRAAQHLLGASA